MRANPYQQPTLMSQLGSKPDLEGHLLKGISFAVCHFFLRYISQAYGGTLGVKFIQMWCLLKSPCLYFYQSLAVLLVNYILSHTVTLLFLRTGNIRAKSCYCLTMAHYWDSGWGNIHNWTKAMAALHFPFWCTSIRCFLTTFILVYFLLLVTIDYSQSFFSSRNDNLGTSAVLS